MWKPLKYLVYILATITLMFAMGLTVVFSGV